eukprot:c53384_g1_i1.p1 GENE.c53384_g1_i1~~c53384_g1_i1.p1  ORF type:complete len:237 (+),score=49.91 c53384_g1_i1:30-713(+)
MSRVVVVSASGNAGFSLVREALGRGHHVTAVVRDIAKLATPERLAALRATGHISNLRIAEVDVEGGDLVPVFSGADAVVNAYAPPLTDTERLTVVTTRIAQAVGAAGAKRLVQVGGAGGSVWNAEGGLVIDAPWFPAEYVPIARAHINTVAALEASGIDWAVLAPGAFFEQGERNGKYTLGTNNLVHDGTGKSRITYDDYAIALVDELEKGEHHNQRYTVAYGPGDV